MKKMIKFACVLVLGMISFMCSAEALAEYHFSYTGEYQEFVVPKSGLYKLEVWGAKGGDYNTTYVGGRGGYSKGEVYLKKGQKLYVFVGEKGVASKTSAGTPVTFNGGGANIKSTYYQASGGGATDIRLYIDETGSWDNEESLLSRFIVAGGGGSGAWNGSRGASGGAGGGLVGETPKNTGYGGSYKPGNGGTQTTGIFGRGGDGPIVSQNNAGAGGSGWYGGGGGDGGGNAGGGGSGFILTSDSVKNVPANYTVGEEYYLENAETIDGASEMPCFDGSTVMTGNDDNGYAKITYLLNPFEIVIEGIEYKFDANIHEYDIYIKEDTFVNIKIPEKEEDYIYIGDGAKTFKINEVYYIYILSPTGDLTIYKYTIKEKKLNVENISFDEVPFEFDPKIFQYNLTVPGDIISLTPKVVSDGTYTIKGNEQLKIGENEITITVTKDDSSFTYTFNVTRERTNYSSSEFQEFSYTGSYQEYIVPKTGYYQLEVWGAKGGNYNSTYVGGNGGYSKGTLFLNKDDKLYVFVGEAGKPGGKANAPVTFNGGGSNFNDGQIQASGGGATDIRLEINATGAWNDPASLLSRFIVAGGGGSASSNGSNHSSGGAGGGLEGITGSNSGSTYHPGTGGTQTQGGKTATTTKESGTFGKGANGNMLSGSTLRGGAGGGGWYGGGAGSGGGQSGGGGSGFILTSDSVKNVPKGYSVGQEYYLKNAVTLPGNGEVPTYDGTSTMMGNNSDGHAKISFIGESGIEELILSAGTIEPQFDNSVYEYDIELDSDTYELKIDAILTNTNDIITGLGTYPISGGTTDITLAVTTVTGMVTTYSLHVNRVSSTTVTLDNILVNDISIDHFDKNKYSYVIEVPYYLDKIKLEAIPSNSYQQLSYEQEIVLKGDSVTQTILVTSESKTENQVYTITFNRAQTTYLRSLSIDNQINLDFKPEVFNYDVEIYKDTYELELNYETYSASAVVNVEGLGFLKDEPDPIVITVSNGDLPPSIYTLNLQRTKEITVEELYEYTGDYETFIAPVSGFYELQVWGAKGGDYDNKSLGGKGGYARGVVKLRAGDELYIYVGGEGAKTNGITPGGYNGGGNSSGRTNYLTTSGGGATDIRLVPGVWNDESSLLSRLIVAGGGGSGVFNGSYYGHGGAGGGTNGIDGTSTYSATYRGGGGTQTKGGTNVVCSGSQPGSFGKGGHASTINNSCLGGGGGGGWYGGGSGNSNGAAGGGGSGFVFTEKSREYVPENYNVPEDYYLINTTLINGNSSMPSPTKKDAMIGNNGNGYAKITLLASTSSNNYLNDIRLNDETLLYFDPTTEEYYVFLEKEQYEVKIDAVPKDDQAKVTGTGKIFIPKGVSEHPITVTATDGSVRTYKITFNREADNNKEPLNIKIKGMISSLCSSSEDYCNYEFDKNTLEYQIILPYIIKELEFLPEINPNQKVQIYVDDVLVESFKVNLENDATKVEIKVIAEDEVNESSYIFNLLKDDKTNNYLKDIIISNPFVDIDFNKLVYEYYLEIDGNYSSYDIEAIPESPFATVIMNDGNKNLVAGNNDLIITVTSENGTTKNYIIHMYKTEDTNTYLKSLELSDKDGNKIDFMPGFNKFLNNYSVVVDSDIEEITINASAESEYAKVHGTGVKKLKSGLNRFVISVQSESGNSLDYNLSIFKNKNSNANAFIEVVGYDIGFDKDVYEYFIEIPKEVTELEVKVTPEISTTKYSVTGNNNLTKQKNMITVTVTSEAGTKKTYQIEVIKQPSKNNYLKEIQLSEGVLNPTFDKNINRYEVEVLGSASKIIVEGKPEENTTRVVGNGEYTLIKGENEITLSAISEDGDVNVYTIIVNKKLDSDVTLKEIKNDQNSVVSAVQNENYEYIVDVQYEVSELSIEGIANSPNATVLGNGTYPLLPGDNIIILSVTAEDNTEAYYRVNIRRDLSSNDDLMYLFVEEGGLNPRFSETTIYYEVKVPNEVDHLTIEAIPEDKNSKVEIIGNDLLEVGIPKQVIIRVTAPKGNKKDYVLEVTRQEKSIDNLDLFGLETDRGELVPTFNPSTLNYTLEVPHDIEDITITAIPALPTIKVVGEGTYDLVVGKNAISIFVIGQDGIQKDYQIVVTRQKSNDASLSELIVKGSVLEPVFDKEVLEYKVNTAKDHLEFTLIKPTETEATYEVIGNENFLTGENTVTIKVTAPDQVTTREYNIIANKAPSENNNLARLEVVGYTLYPVFNKGVLYYEADVKNNVNSVVIKATPEDTNAQVSGAGLKIITTGENIFNIDVTSESNVTKTYVVKVNRAMSDNNYLGILEPSVGNFKEEFEKELQEYTLEVPSDTEEISFRAFPEAREASVALLDSYPLEIGTNKINIIVTSESGNIRTYQITVIRKEVESSYLKSLKVKDYDFSTEFYSENFEYNLDVNSDTTSLEFTSIVPFEENADIEITGNNNFVTGINEVTIKVTSKNPDIAPSIYTIYVNKQTTGSNYLEFLEVINHELTPEFSKEILEYNLEVESDVHQIEIIANPEDSNARIVEGTGLHNLENGLNEIRVVVKSSLGITRTYKINVTKKLNNNNYLQKLEVLVNNKNMIEFHKEVLEYEIVVPAETKIAEIIAVQEDEKASITGEGVITLNKGENIKEVVVTSEAGEIRIYKISITKEISTDNKVLSITPSIGTLESAFDPDIHEYNLLLDSSAYELEFEVVTSSEYATVTGAESLPITESQSERIIKITAEDGSENIYTIHVKKENPSIALLESLKISDYEFTFDPNTFIYDIAVSEAKESIKETEITAIAKDKDAKVQMMGDLDLKKGMVNIYIIEVIAKDGYTTQVYKLNITRDSQEYTLINSTYEINREQAYITGMEPNFELEKFKETFDNEPDMIHFYDSKGNEITDLSQSTGTKMIVRLEKNGVVYDELVVIVLGDINGDGKANVADKAMINNHILKTSILEDYEYLSGNINKDGNLNVADKAIINNYILKIISSLN